MWKGRNFHATGTFWLPAVPIFWQCLQVMPQCVIHASSHITLDQNFFVKLNKFFFYLFIPLCMITPALKFNRKMHNSYFLKTVLFDIELSLFVYTCMPVLTIWAREHDIYLYLVGFYSKKIHIWIDVPVHMISINGVPVYP